MIRYYVFKQNYTHRDPTYTLYTVEKKWFGLKKTLKGFLIDDGWAFTCTFDDVNALFGRLIKHHCDRHRKAVAVVDKKKMVDYYRKNISVKLFEQSYHCNEKPDYYGEWTIDEYYAELMRLKKLNK